MFPCLYRTLYNQPKNCTRIEETHREPWNTHRQNPLQHLPHHRARDTMQLWQPITLGIVSKGLLPSASQLSANTRPGVPDRYLSGHRHYLVEALAPYHTSLFRALFLTFLLCLHSSLIASFRIWWC